MTRDHRRSPGRRGRWSVVLGLWSVTLIACAAPAPAAHPSAPPPTVEARSASIQLAAPAQPCSGAFVTHTLEHTTAATTRPAALYDSNGTGVSAADLDADGDQDLVLANLGGPSAILWNDGGLRFTRAELPVRLARGVATPDVDGDGRPDIVFTRRNDKPALLRNTGRPGAARFEATTLPDVNNPLYSMAWADLDGDGDLDLVAGSYDTELVKLEGLIFQQRGGGVGVFVYERDGGSFTQHRLAREADALSIALLDLDGDGRRDIWVGNDFDRPDYAWLSGGDIGTWLPALPSSAITENTMSLDLGDVDNDGDQEIFATDMKPLVRDPATLAEWLPMMQRMTRPLTASDPQRPENTLLVRGPDGLWYNQGYERGLDASGWSWSGRFGDLDADGFLDLYVVNGMIADGLFDHLPGAELVEPNVAFRNERGARFSMRPEWGLGSTASGRGMTMADMDGDGDLDIVVNNLEAPAQLFENRTCGGASLLVDLRWPASANPLAVGARLELVTSAGTLTRELHVTGGYLSGDAPQAHFGIPRGAAVERLRVTWPDGAVSEVTPVASQTRVTVER